MSDEQAQLSEILERRRQANSGILDVEAPTAQMVIFALGNELFAFPGANITEILPLSPIYFVPGCPPSLEGVINMRGDIASVIRLSDLLGVERAAIGRPDRNPDGAGRRDAQRLAGGSGGRRAGCGAGHHPRSALHPTGRVATTGDRCIRAPGANGFGAGPGAAVSGLLRRARVASGDGGSPGGSHGTGGGHQSGAFFRRRAHVRGGKRQGAGSGGGGSVRSLKPRQSVGATRRRARGGDPDPVSAIASASPVRRTGGACGRTGHPLPPAAALHPLPLLLAAVLTLPCVCALAHLEDPDGESLAVVLDPAHLPIR